MFRLLRFCLVTFCTVFTSLAFPIDLSYNSIISHPLISHPLISTFKDWKNKYSKQYHSVEEEKHRFNIFINNHDYISLANHKNSDYKLELNEFADLSKNEWLSRFHPFKIRNEDEKQGLKFTFDGTILEDAPINLDWREATKNPRKVKAVVGIKNQQQCGSCWAFSTVASIEGAWALSGHPLISLSEQQLVDCSTDEGNEGCNGGMMDQAFQYVIENGGICTEQSYPYEAVDGTCKSTSCKSAAKITNYIDIDNYNETAIFAAIQNGPISIAIEADQQSFQFYSGGVFSDPSCGTQLDHGVNLVGYGTTSDGKDYWILRNSWGTSWGENGYMRILRGKNICGLAIMPSMPIV
jgi:C1A family cysteine protease